MSFSTKQIYNVNIWIMIWIFFYSYDSRLRNIIVFIKINTFLGVKLDSLFVLCLSLVLTAPLDKMKSALVRDVEVSEGFVVPKNLSSEIERLLSRRDPFRGFDLRLDTLDGV